MAELGTRCSAWDRLRRWIERQITHVSQGDFERLPPSFRNDDGQMASEAYRTVLKAIEVIEGRRGLSARDICSP